MSPTGIVGIDYSDSCNRGIFASFFHARFFNSLLTWPMVAGLFEYLFSKIELNYEFHNSTYAIFWWALHLGYIFKWRFLPGREVISFWLSTRNIVFYWQNFNIWLGVSYQVWVRFTFEQPRANSCLVLFGLRLNALSFIVLANTISSMRGSSAYIILLFIRIAARHFGCERFLVAMCQVKPWNDWLITVYL